MNNKNSIDNLSHKDCVKIVQIRSFFWSVFSSIRNEYRDLPEKTPYLDAFHAIKDTWYSHEFHNLSWRSGSFPVGNYLNYTTLSGNRLLFFCLKLSWFFWLLSNISLTLSFPCSFVSYLLGLVLVITQLTFTCPKPTMETLEKGVKYAES